LQQRNEYSELEKKKEKWRDKERKREKRWKRWKGERKIIFFYFDRAWAFLKIASIVSFNTIRQARSENKIIYDW